jgi:hypothetical protein
MKAQAPLLRNADDDGPAMLDVDPDVIVLAEYLAEKRGMTLGEFLEYLITKEAANGK